MTAAAPTQLHRQVLDRVTGMPYTQLRGLVQAGELQLERPTRWVADDGTWHLMIAEAYSEAVRREAAARHQWDIR